MLKAVSDQHEFRSKERVNDCTKEHQGRHEIKRLGLNTVSELRRDAGNLLVMIFLHRLWKTRLGATR